MGRIWIGTTLFACVLAASAATAGAETNRQTLYTFTAGSLWEPVGTPTKSGNILYGATSYGGMGMYQRGTLFQYDLATQQFQLIYNFQYGSTEPSFPSSPLLLSGSKLYGTTEYTGSTQTGAIYQFDVSTRSMQVLHYFAGGASDGAQPSGKLLQSGNTLYGTTYTGGANNGGTLYKYDLSTGAFNVLYSFGGGVQKPNAPYDSLIQSGIVLYGATSAGGANNDGTIFQFDTAANKLDILYSFPTSNDGHSNPTRSLVQSGSMLYGATGTDVFQFDTSTKAYKVIATIPGINDGGNRDSMTLIGSYLYGMTMRQGAYDRGTIFRVDIETGAYDILQSLGATQADGYFPRYGFTTSGDNFYGYTSQGGGVGRAGILFSYTIPEPASLTLLGLGALGLLHRRRTM